MKSKIDVLKENGSFNKDGSKVKAAEFQGNVFFDANDLIQVKYEMLRSVAKEECSVKDASEKYGLSRQTYYITKAAFDEQGLSALFHKKTGPKQATKLSQDGQNFIDKYVNEHPLAKSSEVNRALSAELHISVHDRTINRYMSKKRRSDC